MAGKNFWVICIDYQPKIYEGAWGKISKIKQRAVNSIVDSLVAQMPKLL